MLPPDLVGELGKRAPLAAAQILRTQYAPWNAHKDNDWLWSGLGSRAVMRMQHHTMRSFFSLPVMIGLRAPLAIPDNEIFRWPSMAISVGCPMMRATAIYVMPVPVPYFVVKRNDDVGQYALLSLVHKTGNVLGTIVLLDREARFIVSERGKYIIVQQADGLAMYTLSAHAPCFTRLAQVMRPPNVAEMQMPAAFVDHHVILCKRVGAEDRLEWLDLRTPNDQPLIRRVIPHPARAIVATSKHVAVQTDIHTVHVFTIAGEPLRTMTSENTMQLLSELGGYLLVRRMNADAEAVEVVLINPETDVYKARVPMGPARALVVGASKTKSPTRWRVMFRAMDSKIVEVVDLMNGKTVQRTVMGDVKQVSVNLDGTHMYGVNMHGGHVMRARLL